MPIGIAPSSMNKLSHPESEKNLTRACFNHNIIFTQSTMSNSTIYEISK